MIVDLASRRSKFSVRSKKGEVLSLTLMGSLPKPGIDIFVKSLVCLCSELDYILRCDVVEVSPGTRGDEGNA